MHHGDPILRIRDVSALLSRSVSAINRDRKAGVFPAHIQLGARSVGWRLSSINRWVEARERSLSNGSRAP